ncbi:MAG: sigma 54-interacting transcriptional regulator [Candidatus Aureabacteria bacterium]|nr:sigma 54-interacting transcriptional regulator [Candidatus Auribacterota bacterium]
MKIIEKLELLERIVTDMNSAVSPDELLNHLMDKCLVMTGATTGSIMLINPETQVLDIRVSRGLAREKVRETKLKLGQGVTGHVALTGKPLLINDADKVHYYVRVRDDLKSELAFPLKTDNQIIGVISVDSVRKNAFGQQDMDILHTLSQVSVQILQKANLIEDLKLKIKDQQLILNIAEIIEEQTEPNKVFSLIMKTLSDAMPVKRGFIAMLDDMKNIKIFYGYHLSEEAMQRGIYKIGEGVIGTVMNSGKMTAVKNISASQEFLNRMKIKRGKDETNSFFALPLKYERKILGVLGMEKSYSDDKDFKSTKELLSVVSSLLSYKVHNYERNRLEKDTLLRQNRELKEKLLDKESGVHYIGKNQKVREILEIIQTVADTEATVLISGETGTGKEILAKMLHYRSRFREKPFVSINCASIPETLLESELFGYKKGAFTGAVSDKKGKFVLADGGSLFLDEIGDMSLPLQAKLLRALQEKIIEPLGDEKSFKVNVRIIAATNRDVAALVRENKFREDLYYRLNVIPVRVPSLSERKEDIPLLIEHFIGLYREKYHKEITGVTERAGEAMLRYRWPGNVRELENVIERAVILSRSTWIDIHELNENIIPEMSDDERDSFGKILQEEIHSCVPGKIYKTVVSKMEKHLIQHALVQTSHNQVAAARWLGVHRNTLRIKVKDYQL